MGNENMGIKLPKTVGRRKKLADISNTPILQKSRAYDEDDNLSKESAAGRRDELENLKKTLAEKEQYIEECKRCMDKLWVNYCRKTKQNDEVILHNSQLFKELTQARDNLKVLEHENGQMSSIYKICKSEMQKKLDEALEQVDNLTKLLEASNSEKALADMHSPVDSDICEKHGLSCEDGGLSISGRSTLRKRQRKSYKEPSLKQNIRQADENITCSEEPIECDNNAAVQKLCKDNEGKALSTSCVTEFGMSQGMACLNTVDGNEVRAEALQQFTVRKNVRKDQGTQLFNDTLLVSTQKSCGRPRRRTASCIGSYKEPPLNTKMRRQPD